uniref:Ketohexokinase n=1 Tax=Panagrolaimus sp. JU765 TaxID=591449 RepID=A0AC34RMT0_9BILA
MEKKILIVGLCCIDTVNYVEKYPEEDSDVRVMEQNCCLGGNSTNTATVLRQFTENVQLCASLLKEDLLLNQLLKESKIDYSSSIIRNDPNISIPHSTVICNTTNGSRTVLHYRGNLPEITATEFKEKFPNGFGNYSWIHFEGRNFEQIHEMMSFVKTSKAENELLMISVEF